MKAKDLIELLSKLDPEKTVMIQQGGDIDYMTVHSVRNLAVWDEDGAGRRNIIAIEFS